MTWDRFLNESGICGSGYGGNRPCDNGAICDKCQAKWVQEEYEKVKNKSQ